MQENGENGIYYGDQFSTSHQSVVDTASTLTYAVYYYRH